MALFRSPAPVPFRGASQQVDRGTALLGEPGRSPRCWDWCCPHKAKEPLDGLLEVLMGSSCLLGLDISLEVSH